jgi:alkanesulfonate monooxygenase SsuD/methylene tetrahydromethanopterin reductase-like flavin-dependent oxidoreductase (luciferase family)
MHLMYFTEQPMSDYPREAGREAGNTALMISNEHFDPAVGSRLYNERLIEYKLVEDVGFDGIMLNEHHNAPFCMQAKTNVFCSILAAVTDKVKIVPLGNPLPLAENPVRIAEELAMIDMISKGRLVSGFVRGGGTEQLAAGVNPAYNRERFAEAHDLIIKTWTQPGPFRWEGKHFQHRVVNPWALPLQQPHPRVWIPGVASAETTIWAAQHRYPYICLNTTVEATKKIWAVYDEAAEEVGYTPGPENRGYLLRVHVQDDHDKAVENASEFNWMMGEFTGLAHPVWSSPAGYASPSNRRALVEIANGRRPSPRGAGAPKIEEQLESMAIIAGTPDEVIEKLRVVMSETRPGIFGIWGNDGAVSHEDSKRCIELLGNEVLPAVREIADDLGLTGPFEANAPVSLEHGESAVPATAAAGS